MDTSALVAVALEEPESVACTEVLTGAAHLAISAGTFAEAMILSGRRGFSRDMKTLIDGLALEIVPVDANFAEEVADAYAQWGKGVHPARLNFGDCFAYALAQRRNCPLLFVGRDFAQTDVRRALDAPAP
ncbi:MAG: type II toxin-antitoxin system VapC family toxin [Oceanicaulis sp.]